MDFIDQIRALAAQVSKQREVIRTEESTKNSLILPFIKTLGYDVFDPTEVIPEFDANFGTKLGYKCDYAIFREDKPAMLFECKWCGRELEKKDEDQLRQYFAACTDAKFAVVTNGLLYRFFTDVEKEHVMDDKPFLEFDMLEIKATLVDTLKRFTKSAFNKDELIIAAVDLKYTGEVMRILGQEFSSPSEEFVKFFAGRVHDGKLTAKIVEKFTGITRAALKQYISDRISDTLKSALDKEAASQKEPEAQVVVDQEGNEKGLVTTPEEIEGYHIVRALLSKTVLPERIFIRDTKQYCGVLLDDNRRKPICRLYFNSDEKVAGFFDEIKKETKEPISRLSDLYKYGDRFVAIVANYDNRASGSAELFSANGEDGGEEG